MQNNKVLLRYITIIVVSAGALMWLIQAAPKLDDEWKKRFKEHYHIYSLPMPESISFAGETIPLTNDDIIERYDRELLTNIYWQSQTVLFIKRAHKYFPEIEPILKANGIPDDFKYLCLAESGLQPLVVSPAGAASYWQFLDKTAKSFGLVVNEEIDERYHLQKATEAACKYFNQAYRTFGSWSMVAASYNMGIEGLRRQMLAQGETQYDQLYLNQETARYVLRIVAIKQIVSNPEKYGFYVAENHSYKRNPMVKIAVAEQGLDLYAFTKQYGCTYKDLKYYNPWLRKTTLSTRETVYIELPRNKVEKFISNAKDTIMHNALPDDMIEIEHIVKSGETLQSIANLYNVPVAEITSLNQLKQQTLTTGTRLRIRKMKME